MLDSQNVDVFCRRFCNMDTYHWYLPQETKGSYCSNYSSLKIAIHFINHSTIWMNNYSWLRSTCIDKGMIACLLGMSSPQPSHFALRLGVFQIWDIWKILLLLFVFQSPATLSLRIILLVFRTPPQSSPTPIIPFYTKLFHQVHYDLRSFVFVGSTTFGQDFEYRVECVGIGCRLFLAIVFETVNHPLQEIHDLDECTRVSR